MCGKPNAHPAILHREDHVKIRCGALSICISQYNIITCPQELVKPLVTHPLIRKFCDPKSVHGLASKCEPEDDVERLLSLAVSTICSMKSCRLFGTAISLALLFKAGDAFSYIKAASRTDGFGSQLQV